MNWLTRFILSAGGHKVPEVSGFETDNVYREVGIHVSSFLDEDYRFVSKTISEELLAETITNLNWNTGFYQVLCTKSDGVTMEVGGSLNGEDGLSAVYFNGPENIRTVTSIPPESVSEMIEIMILFYRGDDKWKTRYAFK